ncbi:hypothetical protein [Halobacillus trueperi]|uniref:hypothetical protein n=1 Tax=Halobacillus trueperi TaxID=156205 RepID=UPI0037361A06
MVVMWLEREAGMMLYRHPSHNEGKERQDMRPSGCLLAPIFFSALSVSWTLQSQKTAFT